MVAAALLTVEESLAIGPSVVFVVLDSPSTLGIWLLPLEAISDVEFLVRLYFCHQFLISPIFSSVKIFNFFLESCLNAFTFSRSQVIYITVSSTTTTHIGPVIAQKSRWDMGWAANSFMLFMPKY